MADVGIQFTFRASTAAFQRGVAAANNSIKDLKKSLREFDVGNGFKQLLGVGGVIQGFRATINAAQDMRAEFEKMGKAVPEATRSVAELGDAMDAARKGAAELAVTSLSYVTRFGEGLGSLINRIRGVSKEQEDLAAASERAAQAQEKRLAEAREANSPEKMAAADKRLAEAERRASNKATGSEGKLVDLINQKVDLEEQLQKEGPATAKAKEIRAQLIDNQREQDALTKEMDAKAAADKQRQAEAKTAAEEKVKRERLNKVGLTVEELAAQETGGFTAGDDPRLRARKTLQLEQRAKMLGERGDIKGALDLQGKADQLRKGLEGVSATSQVLTPDTAKTAFSEALTATNQKLEAVEKALGGIIKTQK